MIAQDREAERGKVLARSYDYVIVGGGSAGCVVARRLVEGSDATVLLLEAGKPGDGRASLWNPPQWVENIGSAYDWTYRYEPSPRVAHRAIPLSLGKLLGGSGSINGMVWARGNGPITTGGRGPAMRAGISTPSCRCLRSPKTGRTARVSSVARVDQFMSSALETSIRWRPHSSRPAVPTGCRTSMT
jgi:hypothetical protein